MQFVHATQKDIECLVNLRINFLETVKKFQPENELTLRKNLEAFFTKKICSDDFCAIIIKEKQEVLGCGLMQYYDRPPTHSNPTGRFSLLYNIFVYQQHRRKGLAKKIVLALMKLAQENGAEVVDLGATVDGFPIYEKLGFKPMQDVPMQITLANFNFELYDF